ncbi:MAG: exopolysaccharide biosynthesis polyprenyl glycosylphosphotransferase [Candidatus Sulfopaludibacter sp.]|nr:exopolysaccharide biosynthesis polyprenyl glycosylphosphotransferase [Candidatus Sulfopaludibacter sp.]
MAITLSRPTIQEIAPPLTAIVLLWLLTATGRKTYRREIGETPAAALLRVAESATAVSIIAVILTFASSRFGNGLSRSFILLFVPISFLSLAASFFTASAIARLIAPLWPGEKRIAVLGFGRLAQEVVEAIGVSTGSGASVRGLILPAGFAMAGTETQLNVEVLDPPLPVLGTTHDLAEVINRESLDRIILACDTLTEPEVEHCGEVLKRMGVTVSRPISTVIPDAQVSYHNLYGLHLVDVQPSPFTAWQEVLKRGTDVLVSLVLILLLVPLFIIIAGLIVVTSDGPVLYRAPRVGKGGRYFTFWKFRSMYCAGPERRELTEQNEHSGHLFKVRCDPRITPLGRVLRRFSLDELPQLFNVLLGDMALVGPRPLPAEDLDPDGMSQKFRGWAEQRARVRPGITGLWQVSGRSDVPFSEMVELDVQYIRDWSLKSDMSILMATPRAVITGRGAY